MNDVVNVSTGFFFNNTATIEIYTYRHTLSPHDALPICLLGHSEPWAPPPSLPLPSQGEGPSQKPAAEAAPAGVAEAMAHSHVPRWCSPASRSWNSALVTSSRSSIGLSTRSLAPSRSRLAWLSRLASPVITSTGRRDRQSPRLNSS